MGNFSFNPTKLPQNPDAFGRDGMLREFLLMFLPVAVLVLAGTWSLGEARIKAEIAMLMAEEKTYVELSQGRLMRELAVPIRHMASLANEKPVRQVYEATEGADSKQMEEAFFSLMSRNPSYDKVRWIDNNGWERVRVNNVDGQPQLVARADLQDKHDRYFYLDTLRLEKGEIYISPLDLNVDNGQFELPYKPTIRVATRIFAEDGSPRGILIINIAARAMLNAFVDGAGPAADRIMLLNAGGFWLKSPDPNDEWDFLFQGKNNLGNRHPRAWEAMANVDQGQILLPDGLWTWDSLSPVSETDIRLSHDIHWKVVTRLPATTLSALHDQVWPIKLLSALIILSLFGGGIGRLIQAKTARARAEREAALARSEAEAARRLQEAQASFRMLFEANTSGLLVADAEGRIIMANPAFETMFGYRCSELLNHPVEMLLPETLRADHAEQRKAYQRQPTSRAMGAGRDLHGTRKNGEEFPIEIGLSPFQDNNQAFVLATVADISERKRAQDEIMHMNEVLEQRVAERTAELLSARHEAERLASVKGNFLANMSHEIRTPMNAILGLAYLLEKAHLPAEEHNLVKKIRIAGRSLLGIINDILDFSKIESGRLEIEQAPFRLNDVLDNVATLMSAVEYKPDVELIMGPAPEGMEFLRGDALRLEQILVNLTSNALKFTERGSVALTVEHLPAINGQNYLRFSVRDTGKGIAADKQAEIFSPFAQEDTSTTRRFGGTGLGLSICQYLVKMMDGEIGVGSELGKGSEFWFVLPVELVEPLDYMQPTMAFQNVLIADDHPVALETMAATVRSLGWNPEVVSSGEEALQRVLARAENNKLPDLLLLDWRMPGIDGLTAGLRIKNALGDIPNAPLIVMTTAHDRDALLREPGANIVDAILNKPVTASALYNVVSAAKRRQQGDFQPETATLPLNDRRLRSLRVLVVDDSEINRDMARRILESEGACVHLADDGKTALEWLSDNPDSMDVVLMDIQMPLMDGYEATRRIRDTLNLTDLPIIALTAGAFKNQQTAALAAGMNGFIAKPFDVDDLITQLRQYAPEQDRAPSAPITTPAAVSESGPKPIIDLERGLRNWGDVETYHRYLRKFADAHGRDGDEIGALIGMGLHEQARVLTHKLKGSAGNLAMMALWELAEKIERTLIEGHDSADWPQALQRALDEALREISGLTTPDTAHEAAVSRMADSGTPLQLCEDLLLALDRDNPDEAEPLLADLEKLLPATLLQPIRELLDNFDFRAAEEQTQALIERLKANSPEL
ncbi:response regulator [Methylomonas sp. SURF-2]|uniref:histidine kinase n=1 Tax=Methylomonas subterranea TaxID=2952225 RepID=A0ABT1TB74_9GAMM|nr:response regulator [Methylomonas sp. SURF-2]MCQ8102718.1 response regulator [Methylomonas sp. SURF-2]